MISSGYSLILRIKEESKTTRIATQLPRRLNSNTEARNFLCLDSYYQRFVKYFAMTSAPPQAGTAKIGNLSWDQLMQNVFEKFTIKLCDPLVLIYPDLKKPSVMKTDASDHSFGTVLSKKLKRKVPSRSICTSHFKCCGNEILYM